MSKVCRVTVNGSSFAASRGDLLLDAALSNGIEIPHDCRSGYCGACEVRVVEGRLFGGQAEEPDRVRACQCRIVADVDLILDEVPEIVETAARVSELVPLAPDVFEICVAPSQRIDYLPGQYFSVRFQGYPARCYSPTVPLDWPADPSLVRFHVRVLSHGRVSSALGNKIATGHRVTLSGPFGSACLRPQTPGRLVLVSSGTGFAPVWAIAEAAIKEKPQRNLVMVTEARSLESLYMIPALQRLALFPGVSIVPVVVEGHVTARVIRQGRASDHVPSLSGGDIVFTAGSPSMVEAVTRVAARAGVKCFSDPFETGAQHNRNTGRQTSDWLSVSSLAARARRVLGHAVQPSA